jgi:two-component system sensor histidine kinase KdpD
MAVMNNGRPDPDQLLARVQEEEAKAARGKLKIFFGASAGVGKTYAMLGAARRQKELGTDVVIGVVETHGRKETEALITGLERLPLCEIPYRGSVLKEFDLDAALARRPALILMDELAHSNVAGSRHPKRWQDVHDLLSAGIDVYSTVNVQHLETLNDVVSGIAGIRVWETVPDRIFDEADEVVLVDLPPDDLLQRLKEGKVYLPQQAERAIRNFFRKGNLIALRELALRRTADRGGRRNAGLPPRVLGGHGMANTRRAAGVHRIGHRGRETGAHRGAPGRATGGPLARHSRAHANLGTGARGGPAAHRPRARTIRFARC